MISKENQKLINNMLNKSKESFLLAIEIYNKPTINIRTEGFVFFICNAWELLIKSYLVKNGTSIHYKDKKNKNRTISITEALRKVMTNEKDPTRINLEAVIGIRNTATHMVIPEYATLFHEIFTACSINYVRKLYDYFEQTLEESIGTDFITLFIPKSIEEDDLKNKYHLLNIKHFENTEKYIMNLLINNAKDTIVNDKIAISYQLTMKQVKEVNKADFTISKASKNSSQIGVIKKAVNYTETHPFSTKQIIDKTIEAFNQNGISFTPVSASASTKFNTHTFNLFVRENKIKENQDYAYKHQINKNVHYTYSMELIQKIVTDVTNNPDLFIKITEKFRKKKN